MKKILITTFILWMSVHATVSFASPDKSSTSLAESQQAFVDLRFGMFIHYNMATYMSEDWADPNASPEIFNPGKLDCRQWAKAAKSANMTYGCLTTKHHSGFAIWDTKTTDYSVMSSPLKRDVVKEFADAFRAEGLKVMLYFSILDTHHHLRPNCITPKHIEMVKAQLTELLTNYGEISAIFIDGWDAPWSRISYDDVPFEDIYLLIKSLQPNCVVMDLNAAKYPSDILFYTDIKSYEQNAGQHISKESNRLPAMSCLPLNAYWFWKEDFPRASVKSPEDIVNNNIIPFNAVYCNFILNVAPNRDGLIDDNAVEALTKIGKLWKHEGPLPKLPSADAPIIASNLAKGKPCDSSWSHDSGLMDFANDDNFGSAWISNPAVKKPWYSVEVGKSEQAFNMIVITEAGNGSRIRKYRLEYLENNVWKPIAISESKDRIKIHRFDRVWGNKVRMLIDEFSDTPMIAEFGVYNERR